MIETTTLSSELNVDRVREDFPILSQCVHGHPLVYLDNAATTQKPSAVIQALVSYYSQDNANIHRGVHLLSQRATDAYEATRQTIRRFMNAAIPEEVVFVRGTTEGINLVAQTFGRRFIGAGDEILISTLEHHSNIVPWQMLCEEKGAVLRVAPVNDAGEIDMVAFSGLVNARTKLVAVGHVSNALGTLNPVKQIIEIAHAVGARVLLDGAQAAAHIPIDVQALDCDFYTFSGHKLYGPTGIGVLYGKAELLEVMPPWQGGGDMIRSVTFEKTTYNNLPYKFEAGTPNIAGTIGLGAAVSYVSDLGLAKIARHEHELLTYGTAQLQTVTGLKLRGTAREKTGILSFTFDDIHPHDVGTILDRKGIAIRTGHHCAQPLMERFGIPATARASLACYNTKAEIDTLVKGLHAVCEVMR